jgi:PAB1-binding protein PBP1
MKRLISSFVVAGAILLMMAGSAQASGAGAVSMTQTFHNATQTFVPPNPMAVNPCTGVLGTLTITYNGVAHVTFLTSGVGAGTGWATFTATGTFTFAGVDGVTFKGRFTAWDGQNFNLQNFAATSILVVHGTGSDGSSLTFHDVAHFSVSASGITLSFDKPTCG